DTDPSPSHYGRMVAYDNCAWSRYPNISELDIGSGLNESIKILLLINRWKCHRKWSLIHLFKPDPADLSKVLKRGAAATVMAAARRVWVSKLDREELLCRSTKKAPFASNTRRPAPASRCCSSPAG